MPYIKQNIRANFDDHLKLLITLSPGDLNYIITKIIDNYLGNSGVSYTSINACIGVLECAKQELYRRIAAPYEDIKIKENGDVFSNKLKEI